MGIKALYPPPKSFCLCSSLKWTYKETKIHLDFSSKNKADWIKVFNDLIDRGLKKVNAYSK